MLLLFFFPLASNAFPDIGSVGQIEKKILKKKSQGVSEQEALLPQDDVKVNIYIFGLTNAQYTVKKCSCFCSCFLFSVLYTDTVLMFQIKRIISSEKWFNYVVTSFFFSEMPKILVGWTTLNGEKKRMAKLAKKLAIFTGLVQNIIE